MNIDEEALDKALRVSPGKAKTGVINEALRDYAGRRELRGLLELRGKLRWKGDLDVLLSCSRQGPGSGIRYGEWSAEVAPVARTTGI